MIIQKIISKINSKKKYKLIQIKLDTNSIDTNTNSFLSFLLSNNLIFGYYISNKNGIHYLNVELKYSISGKQYISEIKKTSTSTNKLYLTFSQIQHLIKNNLQFFIFSTNRGLLSSTEIIQNKIGGELLYIIK